MHLVFHDIGLRNPSSDYYRACKAVGQRAAIIQVL